MIYRPIEVNRVKMSHMANEFRTRIISRRAREVGSEWNNAHSWLGGAPELGHQAWPRGGPRQTPFYFLAQIDLAEVQREIGNSSTLTDGALAFFIGTGAEEYECAVVHVPRSELGKPTAPPADAPAVLVPDSDIFPTTFDDDDPRLFPRWPVDITALEIEPLTLAETADEDDVREAEGQAQVAAVDRQFTRRQFFFKAYHAYEQLGDVERRFWWHGAHYYLACLRTTLRHPTHVELCRRDLELARSKLARLQPTGITGVLGALGLRSNRPNDELKKAQDDVTRCETRLAEVQQRATDFERFVREVAEWVPAKDPWELMSPEAVEVLRSTFERGKTAFGQHPRFHRPHSFDDLETEMLVALTTADDRAYAGMPEAMRNLINTHYLLPSSGWHQMFGRGVDIQGNAALDNEGNVMLLQLVYDDMLQWRFGDMGAFQFWIPPEDLASGNWSAVRVTFECG